MQSQYKHIIGIMSGTSLDGIDIALVKVKGSGLDVQYELIEYDSFSFEEDVVSKILKQSISETSSVDGITELHYQLGEVYNDALNRFLNEKKVDVKIDAIGLHGQTIHHLPQAKYKSTLQIGSPSHLAFHQETTVVSNFREMDIIAGGDGAPLVPYTDYVMFKNDIGQILLNIGGISNVTVISKNARLDEVYAFDTGPGNMMMNSAMQYFYQKPYDKDALIARKGKRIDKLLNELIENPYFKMLPPKSTGREMFREDLVLEICKKYENRPEDVLYTFTEFTAETIYLAYQDFIKNKSQVERLVVSGGGAYNPLLMDLLKDKFDIDVITQEDLGFSSDAKEALAFALLANDTLEGVANNLPSATGAQVPVILGQITYNPKGV